VLDEVEALELHGAPARGTLGGRGRAFVARTLNGFLL